MMNRAARSHGNRERRWCPTPSILLAGAAVFVVLGGSAVAANGLIHAGDIAPGAVASKAIRDGAVQPRDLSASMRAFLEDSQAVAGAQGDTGPGGTPGSNGPNGANGVDGTDGADGIDGVDGINGTNGTVAPLSATKGLTPLWSCTAPATGANRGGQRNKQ